MSRERENTQAITAWTDLSGHGSGRGSIKVDPKTLPE